MLRMGQSLHRVSLLWHPNSEILILGDCAENGSDSSSSKINMPSYSLLLVVNSKIYQLSSKEFCCEDWSDSSPNISIMASKSFNIIVCKVGASMW